MKNPILQLLNGKQINRSDAFERVSAVKSVLEKGNADSIFQSMIQTNPQFKDFVIKNKDKTIEDIALEYDLDINLLKLFL